MVRREEVKGREEPRCTAIEVLAFEAAAAVGVSVDAVAVAAAVVGVVDAVVVVADDDDVGVTGVGAVCGGVFP